MTTTNNPNITLTLTLDQVNMLCAALHANTQAVISAVQHQAQLALAEPPEAYPIGTPPVPEEKQA